MPRAPSSTLRYPDCCAHDGWRGQRSINRNTRLASPTPPPSEERGKHTRAATAESLIVRIFRSSPPPGCLSAFMTNCPSHVQGRPILPECTRRHRSVYVIACHPDVSPDAPGRPEHPSRSCKLPRRFSPPGGPHARPACRLHLPERWLDRARPHSPAWRTLTRQARR